MDDNTTLTFEGEAEPPGFDLTPEGEGSSPLGGIVQRASVLFTDDERAVAVTDTSGVADDGDDDVIDPLDPDDSPLDPSL